MNIACGCLCLLGGLDGTVGACAPAMRLVFAGSAELISVSSAALLRLLGSAVRSGPPVCKDSDCLGEACVRSALALKLWGVTRSVGVRMGVGAGRIFRGEVGGGGRDETGVGSVKKVKSA